MDMYSCHEGEIEEEGLAPLYDSPLGWVAGKKVAKQAVVMAYLPYHLCPLPHDMDMYSYHEGGR